jgi:hypothetical protein
MTAVSLELRRAEQLLREFTERRSPIHVRDQVSVRYRTRGASVTMFERRAAWRKPGEWTEHHVAQIRRRKTGEWALYWRDRNGRWHKYDQVRPMKELPVILAELDRDRTGVFWG